MTIRSAFRNCFTPLLLQVRALGGALVLLLVVVPARAADWCGNGECLVPETCATCPADCGQCIPRRLTTSSGDDHSPVWSHDGYTIAFLSERNGAGAEVFWMPAQGGAEQAVARYTAGSPWQFTDVSWLGTSGDLLVVDMRGIWEVLRVQLQLGPILPIVRTSEEGATPYLSPLLAVPAGELAHSPVSSPDARRLAWASLETRWDTTPCYDRVYALRLYDGTLDTLSGTSDVLGRVVFATGPGGYLEGRHALAFSPDGRQLAFIAAASGWCRGTRRDVWVADLETGVVRRLTTDGERGVDHSGVAWSARNRIAFAAAGDLYTIQPEGTDERRLTETPWDETDPTWAPDGARLGYAANPDGQYDLFVLDGADAALAPSASSARGVRKRGYIVVLKDVPFIVARSADERTEMVRAAATRLVEGRTSRIGQIYAHTINGFSARISRTRARLMAQDPDVAYVEENVRVQASQTNDACPAFLHPPSWGLDRIDEHFRPLNDAFNNPKRREPAHVYVVDTGVRTTHRDFGGRADQVWSYDGRVGDCSGHGTHVAATIAGATYGVATTARIHSLTVLDCNGDGWNSDVVAALDWIAGNHLSPAVVNLSLGAHMQIASMDEAVRRVIAAGVTPVVAAGNDAADAGGISPGDVAEAITVGASDFDDRRLGDSNFGGVVDLFAPGDGIVSAGKASDTAEETRSGTSMAAPHVAGMAAAYLQAHPQASPAEVANAIVGRATGGVLSGIPTGTANRLLYVFDQCGRCGDGSVQGTEECDDANGTNGDGCENTCYFTRWPCDVQCCDGSTSQRVWARTADECRSYTNGALCNAAGSWTSVAFNFAPVAAMACPQACGVECCTWSASPGLFALRGAESGCVTAGQYKCAGGGQGVRNLLYYPNGPSGGPLMHYDDRLHRNVWTIYDACTSR